MIKKVIIIAVILSIGIVSDLSADAASNAKKNAQTSSKPSTLNLDKLNTYAKQLLSKKISKNDAMGKINQNLGSYFPNPKMLLASEIEDIQRDKLNEAVVLFDENLNKKDKELTLSVLKWSSKNMLEISQIETQNTKDLDFFDEENCQIFILDYIKGKNKQVFWMSGSEYPGYELYKYDNNKLVRVNLEAIGLRKHAQFVELKVPDNRLSNFRDDGLYDRISKDYDKKGMWISLGSRVTGGLGDAGLYGFDIYVWEGTEFIYNARIDDDQIKGRIYYAK